MAFTTTALVPAPVQSLTAAPALAPASALDASIDMQVPPECTGRLNINRYTYKIKNLKNRKLKRKRKQERNG